MKTYWNTKFKRNHECTNVVAIMAESLPDGPTPRTKRFAFKAIGYRHAVLMQARAKGAATAGRTAA